MNRTHVAVVSVLVGVAAVLGAVAVIHTVSLGSRQRASSTASLRARAARLDRFEASLRRALARTPPPLPPVPNPAPVSAVAPPAAAPQARVVYRRPPPIVVVRHTHHGDDGFEGRDGEGGGDD